MSKQVGLRWTTSSVEITEEIWPDRLMGPFLPVSSWDIDLFNDSFSDEIDSAFSSSICCCDLCYDCFRTNWPDVAFREMEFQKNSMEVSWVLENSRIPGFYSPTELSTLSHFVRCVRCEQFVPHNIWIYEHKFSDAEEIETAINELLIIGNTTPFLLLNHEFAQQVFKEISEAAASPRRLKADRSLFRARVAVDVANLNQTINAIATYAPPPAQFVGEGRFNHAGTPMLYLASAPEVAAAEIGIPGETCHVAELKLLQDIVVLDLVDLDEDSPDFQLMQALASSALLSAPNSGSGWLKKQYVFSRFVGDCARAAGFDAIRYGSTKNVNGSNIVLLEPPTDVTNLFDLIDVKGLTGLQPAKRF
ncbi:RES family NAD+ phosphorylase [Parasphingorhabdus sp.]|uniref:RES family NAD+ phosphorylase n=1 Tax=Parasphingorhabdus sp. TaxID=2709688 RepID=UPI0032EFAC84